MIDVADLVLQVGSPCRCSSSSEASASTRKTCVFMSDTNATFLGLCTVAIALMPPYIWSPMTFFATCATPTLPYAIETTPRVFDPTRQHISTTSTIPVHWGHFIIIILNGNRVHAWTPSPIRCLYYPFEYRHTALVQRVRRDADTRC